MSRSIIIFIFAVHISSLYVVVFGIQRIVRAPEEHTEGSQNSEENEPNPTTNATTVGEDLRKLYERGVEYHRPRYNETNCICSRIYDPVCASNDRSYFNMCQFQCAMSNNNNHTDIKILYQGNCIPF